MTGHSLGGGLALSVSVRRGAPAIVFDPSPRIFDGWGDKHLPAERLVVYEHGEILQIARAYTKKIFKIVKPEQHFYASQYRFAESALGRHSGTRLAYRLLESAVASGNDLRLKQVFDTAKNVDEVFAVDLDDPTLSIWQIK